MALITSILDTDLYKLTMQQAVLQHYPQARVSYRFTNRAHSCFSKATFDKVELAVTNLHAITLSAPEHAWLQSRCPYFTKEYLDYLSSFHFNPEVQIKLSFTPVPGREEGEWGNIEAEIEGLWVETILYEVPLMAIISEAYFTTDSLDWDYRGQFAQAQAKGKELFLAGCIVSEFGTRRRRTLLSHDIIMRGLISANHKFATGVEGRGKLAGTSNYDLTPIGTIAHEWIMGIAAIEGYEHSNGRAMDLWEETYPSGALSIALTDTFSTKPFFDDFVSNPERGRRWRGLRQDSGDPFKFVGIAKGAFERVGADPLTKMIVFSDGLDIPRCLALKKASSEAGIGCSFGVGTNLTNDYVIVPNPLKNQEVPGEGDIRIDTGEGKSKALNMVIKLFKINGEFCVKISDELTKNTGDPEAVALVKKRFGLDSPPLSVSPLPL